MLKDRVGIVHYSPPYQRSSESAAIVHEIPLYGPLVMPKILDTVSDRNMLRVHQWQGRRDEWKP